VPIPDEDLRAFCLLSDADHTAVNHQREDHTRLGFALQLCALRYLGFVPHHLHTAPWEVVAYPAHQLHVSPESLQAYGQRIKTRTMHLQQVQIHRGFRRALPLDFYALQTWLVERALEHDQPRCCSSWRVTSSAVSTLSVQGSRAWNASWRRHASRPMRRPFIG
jgi:hypothetical protein